MKRIVLNLMVGLLTFSIGATSSMVRVLFSDDSPEELLASHQGWFEPLKVVGGLDACGVKANYHTRELSDGTRIVNSCETMASPAAANRALKDKLGTAEIITREPSLDAQENIVGEKIVAKTTGVMELHTFGNIFCSTEAASLKHLDWYEHH